MNNRAIITENADLKPFIGTVVGSVQVNESWVNHNNSFECAAWWEDTEIQKGIYHLTLEKNYLATNELYLRAKISSVVVDDFFPALWAGVAISRKPYVPVNIGQVRQFNHRVDLVEAIDHTGNIPGNKMDYCVNPLIIDGVISAARDSLSKYRQLMNNYCAAYDSEGDGKYHTNLSMIGHAAENLAALSRAIDKLLLKRHSLNTASSLMQECYIANTAWAA